MFQWLKRLFSGPPLSERRLGDLTHGAKSPEQAIVVALTFQLTGLVQGYVEENYFQVTLWGCDKLQYEGTYRINLNVFSPREVLDCTLDEFVEKFKVSDKVLDPGEKV